MSKKKKRNSSSQQPMRWNCDGCGKLKLCRFVNNKGYRCLDC